MNQTFSPTYFLATILISVAAAFSSLAHAGYHIQFGTLSSESQRVSTDQGYLLSESEDGTIMVAGEAAGAVSDVGGLRSKPMVAAFTTSGELVWQQVFDLRGWKIIALNAKEGAVRAVLWRSFFGKHGRHMFQGESVLDKGRLELWALGEQGELDELLVGIDHSAINQAVHTSDGAVTVWLGALNQSGVTQNVSVRTFDWGGNAISPSNDFLSPHFPSWLVDHNGGIAVDLSIVDDRTQSFLVYVDSDGGATESLLIPRSEQSRVLDVRRQGDIYEVFVGNRELYGPGGGLRRFTFDPVNKRLHLENDYKALNGASGRVFPLNRDELLFAGGDLLAPVVAKLSKERELLWVRRISSAKKRTHLAGAIELTGGEIVLTGSTSLHLGHNSDGVLIIADAEGEYLKALGKGLVYDGELAVAHSEVAAKYGLEFNLHELGINRKSRGSSDDQLLPRHVPLSELTGNAREGQLLAFLKRLLAHENTEGRFELPRGIRLVLNPLSITQRDGRAFAYSPSTSHSQLIPQMAVDISQGEEVAKELIENVLPYLNSTAAAHEWLLRESGFFFRNGDRLAKWQRQYLKGKGSQLKPAKIALAAQALKSSFSELSDNEKQMLRRYAGKFTIATILNERGDIRHLDGWYAGSLDVPVAKSEKLWRWILNDIKRSEEGISSLSEELESRLGITIHGRPKIKPHRFRMFLEQLKSELKNLPVGDLRIRIAYPAEGDESNRLVLWQENQQVESMVLDAKAEKIARLVRQLRVLE